MASILLYHSYMKDISRLCCAGQCMTHTRNMNHIIRNVFVCTPFLFLLLCCCLWYGPLNDFLTSHLTYSMLQSIPICTEYNQCCRSRYMIYGVGSRISLHCIPRHMMRPRTRVMCLWALIMALLLKLYVSLSLIYHSSIILGFFLPCFHLSSSTWLPVLLLPLLLYSTAIPKPPPMRTPNIANVFLFIAKL
jgi:hypothetical protein